MFDYIDQVFVIFLLVKHLNFELVLIGEHT
jgi:hypothetical protein